MYVLCHSSAICSPPFVWCSNSGQSSVCFEKVAREDGPSSPPHVLSPSYLLEPNLLPLIEVHGHQQAPLVREALSRMAVSVSLIKNASIPEQSDFDPFCVVAHHAQIEDVDS